MNASELYPLALDGWSNIKCTICAKGVWTSCTSWVVTPGVGVSIVPFVNLSIKESSDVAYTPFAKVMADFFRHKNQHDVLIQFAQFWVDLWNMCHWSCPMKICWFFLLTRYALMSKGYERFLFVFFSNLSLNIIINFMEWNFTDSDEILENWILARCLNLV